MTAMYEYTDQASVAIAFFFFTVHDANRNGKREKISEGFCYLLLRPHHGDESLCLMKGSAISRCHYLMSTNILASLHLSNIRRRSHLFIQPIIILDGRAVF